MCSQGMPAAVGGWVTGIRMEKGGWRKRCLFFHRDRVRGERKTESDFLLQSWAWDWEHRLSGAVGEGWVCLQPYLLPCEGLFLGWQKVPVRAGSWGKATHGRRGLGGIVCGIHRRCGGKERLQLVFCAKDETGWFVWANREQILYLQYLLEYFTLIFYISTYLYPETSWSSWIQYTGKWSVRKSCIAQLCWHGVYLEKRQFSVFYLWIVISIF